MTELWLTNNKIGDAGAAAIANAIAVNAVMKNLWCVDHPLTIS